MATSAPTDALDSWDANAEFWDKVMGSEGNNYWSLLELPSLERLAPVNPGWKALDLATGNGLVARWLAAAGAFVVATDGSTNMLDLAKQRSTSVQEGRITYRRLDVTRESDFQSLLASESGCDGFDVIVMNMAIMDVETLDPLAAALPQLLKRDGVFVAITQHPVFITSNATAKIEVGSDPDTGRTATTRSRVVTQYLRVAPYRGIAHEDQPTWQLYFHRPLHELLGVFFKAGLVLDALEEPHFTDEKFLQPSNPSDHSQIPVLFAFRLRRKD